MQLCESWKKLRIKKPISQEPRTKEISNKKNSKYLVAVKLGKQWKFCQRLGNVLIIIIKAFRSCWRKELSHGYERSHLRKKSIDFIIYIQIT